MNRAILIGLLLVVFASSALATPQQKATRVLVLKKEHHMEIFSGDTVIKTYAVALGRGGLSPKQRQGRPPSGAGGPDSTTRVCV
jgi:murein L,D-transpeptidase YafK